MSKTLKASLCYMLALLLFVIVRILSGYGAFSFLSGWALDIIVTILIQVICLVILPLSLYKILSNKSFKEILTNFGFKKITKKTFIICIFLGVICYFLNICVSSIWNIFLDFLGYSPRGSVSSTTYKTLLDFVLGLFSTALLPAICEEFINRGLMLHSLKEESSYIKAIIISSILFGLFHLNIYQTIYAIFLGLVMGFLTIYSGSIIPAIIIHFMNNGINVFVAFIDSTTTLTKTFSNFLSSFFNFNYFLSFVFLLLFIFLIIFFAFLIFINVIKNEKLKNEKYSFSELCFAIMDLDVKDKQKLPKITLEIQQKLKEIYPVNKNKTCFKDKIVLYTIIFLSTLITIFTYIWGVI